MDFGSSIRDPVEEVVAMTSVVPLQSSKVMGYNTENRKIK